MLSGSKHAALDARQVRLGAKMALIWAKKPTGLPIRVRTAHAPPPLLGAPTHVSRCVLDIDIQANEPRVLEHARAPNAERWRGAEVEVASAGSGRRTGRASCSTSSSS